MSAAKQGALIVAALVLASSLVGTVSVMLPGVSAVDLPTSVVVSICGDGYVNSNEVCDDGVGFNNGAYGSSTAERHCNANCASFGPYCGDGILQVRFTEACDDSNNTSGDLCSSSCATETPAPPEGTGPPTMGFAPYNSSASPGNVSADASTRVVLRGKSFPNASMKFLLDGRDIGATTADANADFVFSTANVAFGTATFGFVATDIASGTSMTTSVVFEVLQGAMTTVTNVFVPPTLVLSNREIEPGAVLGVGGRTVPNAKVVVQISGGGGTSHTTTADAAGRWSVQIDTKPLSRGSHAAKAYFQLSDTVKSGYGRSVSYSVGAAVGRTKSPDLNKDGKVNLVDFSIFLLSWGKADDEPDFNSDGTVNLADFSIMLFAWTG